MRPCETRVGEGEGGGCMRVFVGEGLRIVSVCNVVVVLLHEDWRGATDTSTLPQLPTKPNSCRTISNFIHTCFVNAEEPKQENQLATLSTLPGCQSYTHFS